MLKILLRVRLYVIRVATPPPMVTSSFQFFPHHIDEVIVVAQRVHVKLTVGTPPGALVALKFDFVSRRSMVDRNDQQKFKN